MSKNSYYGIAINDLLYVQQNLSASYFNPIAVQAQQIAEKLLKSVAERECLSPEELLKTHNLKKIYQGIRNMDPTYLQLNQGALALLKDYYFEAKYPGENYIEVSLEECNECLETMYTVLEEVNKYRERFDLKCFPFTKKFATKEDNLGKMELFFEE